ncbi:MAG TPA: hypothetical protein VGI50_07925 [Solirubrobacteraceae bacterium]
MTDRVSERRRAAQLARHYRDQEGLTIAEIARRLGRAEGTVKTSSIRSATGREVKARYRGACRGCGAPTSPRGGKGDAYEYCKRCRPGAIARQWTRERIPEAMRALRRRAVLLRLVAHPHTPARRRSAQTSTSRRMARAVHCHRSVRELGSRPRRRLQRVSMPLTHQRALALRRL